MYIPQLNRNENKDEIISFIRSNSFGEIVSMVNGSLFATHLPFMVIKRNEEYFLQAHMAKANPQWKEFTEQETLIIFNGPHAYVSSSWYDHQNVSTWNYIAVHCYGKPYILKDEELYQSVKTLTALYESKQDSPKFVDDMEDYVRKMLNGITGFEIKIERMEGKWKMSQNRDEKNYQSVIDQLKKDHNSRHVAEVMEERKERLFNK